MLRFAGWSLTNGSQFQYCEYDLKFWCFGLVSLRKDVTHGHSYSKDGVKHIRLRQGNDHESRIGQCPEYISQYSERIY